MGFLQTSDQVGNFLSTFCMNFVKVPIGFLYLMTNAFWSFDSENDQVSHKALTNHQTSH